MKGFVKNYYLHSTGHSLIPISRERVVNLAKTKDIHTVLHYVKYDPENPILIYNPVHISAARRFTRTYCIKNSSRKITVILSEND